MQGLLLDNYYPHYKCNMNWSGKTHIGNFDVVIKTHGDIQIQTKSAKMQIENEGLLNIFRAIGPKSVILYHNSTVCGVCNLWHATIKSRSARVVSAALFHLVDGYF